MPSARMTFIGHLSELRQRIIVSGVSFMIAVGACWPFAPRVLEWLLKPLDRPAIFLGPAEGFLVTFKVAMFGGLIVSSPVLFWQAVAFGLPALKKKEKKIVGLVAGFGALAFLAGLWFGWTVIVPVMIRFFMSFDSEVLHAQIQASKYLGFIIFMLLSAGVAFEFPIVTAGLASVRIITARTLLRHWRYAILGCFVLAAVLTPSPDAVTMLLVAGMLVGLYFAGIAAAAFFGKKK